MIEGVIGFIIGACAVGWAWKKSMKSERTDITVEEAIALLREKGYYTKINVLPEGKE